MNEKDTSTFYFLKKKKKNIDGKKYADSWVDG